MLGARLLENDRRVGPRHDRLVDAALDASDGGERAGGAVLEIEPIEEHGVVAREKRAVVREEREGQLFDLRIGRVDIHDVDLPARHRLVRELVLQPANVVHREAVGLGEPGEAVRTSEELVGEAEA